MSTNNVENLTESKETPAAKSATERACKFFISVLEVSLVILSLLTELVRECSSERICKMFQVPAVDEPDKHHCWYI